MDSQKLFESVAAEMRETALLESTVAVLEWDERTGLPNQAGEYRADQVTLLSGMIHRRKTNPELGARLFELSEHADSLTDTQRASVQKLLKDFQRNVKLPIDLVQSLSKATVIGQQLWDKARRDNAWETFRPQLEEIINLRRQEAALLKSEEGSLYDALLDQYEDGARGEQLTVVFAGLRSDLVQLVQELQLAPAQPTGESWQRPVAVPQQREISKWIAGQIGYSFERGRLDETSHPFCTTLGPHDCRILTRYHEQYFPTAFYGTLHEAGHGLYEQGLPTAWYGLPAGQYASLGVHESQSRLWENMVGRSESFWRWAFSRVQSMASGAWSGLSSEQVYRDANLVKPSLIRVEADEVTYNLHILIRFEIEQLLVSGQLNVADAPDAWNERYEHYLGITPPTHADGILQDVHWSAGLIGYFPTYTLGNIFAAQLMVAAEAELGDLDSQFRAGDFAPLLGWLRDKIHAQGATLQPTVLVETVTGESLSAQPLVKYLRRKLLPIYGA